MTTTAKKKNKNKLCSCGDKAFYEAIKDCDLRLAHPITGKEICLACYRSEVIRFQWNDRRYKNVDRDGFYDFFDELKIKMPYLYIT